MASANTANKLQKWLDSNEIRYSEAFEVADYLSKLEI